MLTFDLDEPLFTADHAFHGLLTFDQITEAEDAWKIAKVDEQAAVAALEGAARRVRRASRLPDNARFVYALGAAMNRANDGELLAAVAVQAYRDAAIAYRDAVHAKTQIRRRAHAA